MNEKKDRLQVGIVEDSINWLEMYKKTSQDFCETMGVNLTLEVAENLKEATILAEKIKSGEIKVDAIFLDDNIERNGDGAKIAEIIRNADYQTTIIGISGTPENQTYTDFNLPKGKFSPTQLESALYSILEG